MTTTTPLKSVRQPFVRRTRPPTYVNSSSLYASYVELARSCDRGAPHRHTLPCESCFTEQLRRRHLMQDPLLGNQVPLLGEAHSDAALIERWGRRCTHISRENSPDLVGNDHNYIEMTPFTNIIQEKRSSLRTITLKLLKPRKTEEDRRRDENYS